MTATELFAELRKRGVTMRVERGRLVTQGLLVPRLRAAVAVHERELVTLLSAEQTEFQRAELECYSAYLAARARAEGHDEATIANAVAWLSRRRPGGVFRILHDRIEIELAEGVTALFRKTNGYACPHYQPLPGEKRCRSYSSNGACARPDEPMCVEWLRVNRQ